MPTNLEPTIDFDPNQMEQLSSAHQETLFLAGRTPIGSRRSRVRVDRKGSADGLTDRFNESTRQLLRERLMIAAITLICFIIAIKVLVLLSGQMTTRTFLMRSISLGILVGIWVYLKRSPQLTLKSLRVLEVLVIAVPISEALLVQYFETGRLVEEGDVARVATMRATMGAAVSLFIAIYGIFIPSNWRRTAGIALTAALLPTLLMVYQMATIPELKQIDFPVFVTPVLLIMMAIVATLGAHVVHSIRREVETARQYGQYQLTDEIGRGGMGVVYRAEHQMLKRPAAIKLIRSECAADELAIAKFEQEVQLSATLSHWNTVQIYDYGRTASGDFYYVMEYLTGKTLGESLAKEGPKSVEATLAIIKQVCAGLGDAHSKSMVHRDLKPANIFLSDCGGECNIVKILDFGLAVTTTDAKHDKSVSGSPAYMSPEQIRGEAVDSRSDIYAIGCVLYECLTGNSLFTGEMISDVFNQHLSRTRSFELPAFAADLKPIIEKCIAPNREERFANVSELRTALGEINAV